MADLTEFLKSQNVSPEGLLIPTQSYVTPTKQPFFGEYNITSPNDNKDIDYRADSNF